jgi:hypothetical protein
LVVDSVTELLFAAQIIAFGRLYGDVTKEKLDLLQFATCKVTQTPMLYGRERRISGACQFPVADSLAQVLRI